MEIKSVKELIEEHDGNYSDVGYRRGYHHGYVTVFENINRYMNQWTDRTKHQFIEAIMDTSKFQNEIMKWRFTEPFDKMVLPPTMKIGEYRKIAFGIKDDI